MTARGPSTCAAAAQCSVLSLNVHVLPFGLRTSSTSDFKAERLADLADRLGDDGDLARVHVVALQGLFSTPYVPAVAKARFCRQHSTVLRLREEGFLHHAVPKQPSWLSMAQRLRCTDTGLVIASKFPITARESFIFRVAPVRGRPLEGPLGALFAKVELPTGQSLLVFAVALSDCEGEALDACIAELKHFVSSTVHQHPGCAVVLAGDFGANSIMQPAQQDEHGYLYDGKTRQAEAYKRLVRQLDPRSQYVDVLLRKYGQHVPMRPPDVFHKGAGVAGAQRLVRTDYVFFCANPAAARATPRAHQPPRVVDASIEKLVASTSRPYTYVSDHFGTLLTVAWPTAARRSSDLAAGPASATDAAPRNRAPRRGITAWLPSWVRDEHTSDQGWLQTAEVVVVAACAFCVPWVGVALVLLYCAWVLVRQLLHRIEQDEPFGIVTASTRAGAGPVQEATAHTSWTSSSPSFAAAWRAIVQHRSWVPCVGQRDGAGESLVWQTALDVDVSAAEFSSGLKIIGLDRGNCVGIRFESTANALVAEVACLTAGIVTCPLTGDSAVVRNQLDSTKCTTAIVGLASLHVVLDSRSTLLDRVVLIDNINDSGAHEAAAERGIQLHTFESVCALGRENPSADRTWNPREEDPVSILCEVGDAATVQATKVAAVERVVSHKVVDNRQLMAAIHQVDACQLFGKQPPAEAAATTAAKRLPAGRFLAAHSAGDFFGRLLCFSAVLTGLPVVACPRSSSALDESRASHPTVVVLSAPALIGLQREVHGTVARWWRTRSAVFRAAWAARVRLQRQSLDSSLVKRVFFDWTYALLGGRVCTIIVPCTEALPYPLKAFAHVCLAQRTLQVTVGGTFGIVAVNGVPPPQTLVRLADTGLASGTAWEGAGEMMVSGPAACTSAKDPSGWVATGVVGRWVGSSLVPVCAKDGLLRPMVDVVVAAAHVEREYTYHCPYVHNIFITCRTMRPLVAVVVPKRELVDVAIARRQAPGAPPPQSLTWHEYVAQAKPIIEAQLRLVSEARELPLAHSVAAVHLHPHPFQQHAAFVSQYGSWQRTRMATYFATNVEQLYSDMGLAGATPTAGEMRSSGATAAPFYRAPEDVLPADATALRPRAPFVIDIGGTCAKLAYFQPPRGSVTLPDYCEDMAAPRKLRLMFRARLQDFFRDEAIAAAASVRVAGQGADPGDLRFLKLPTSRVTDFLQFVRSQHASRVYRRDAVASIPATGGGAHRFSNSIAGVVDGMSLMPVKEMDSLIAGLRVCLEACEDSIFAYDWVQLAKIPPRLRISPAADPARSGSVMYPFLVVNIGSGVSIVKCTSPDEGYVRVGGTPIGGGTFWGLVRSLTNLKSWDEVHELTRLDGPGDHSNVDLLVGDIYGFNAKSLPPRLTVDTVASCLGKLATAKGGGASVAPSYPGSPAGAGVSTSFPDGSTDLATELLDLAPTPTPPGTEAGRAYHSGDVVKSLLMMISVNVTQITHLVAERERVANVFFTGGFVRDNELVWMHIARLMQYWSNDAIVAHFLHSDGFLGVIGALGASADPIE